MRDRGAAVRRPPCPVLTESTAFASYEQIAVLGMLVSRTRLELAKQPDRAQSEALRRASIDPDVLVPGATGYARA